MINPDVVFHVSPIANLDSIRLNGISPEFSKGNIKASWYVTEARLEWAVIHVAAKYDLRVSEIAVWAVFAPNERLSLFPVRSLLYPKGGVAYCKAVMYPHHSAIFADTAVNMNAKDEIVIQRCWDNYIPF